MKWRATLALSFLLFFLLPSSCNQNKIAKPLTDALAGYIYAYTTGYVSKAAPIRVRFTRPAVSADQVGQAAPKGVLSLSPSVDGQASWEDEFTLLFQPDAFLPANTQFLGSLNLKKVFDDTPSDAGQFEFNFQTRKTFFNVEVDGIQAPDLADLSKQEVVGALVLSDVDDPANIEKSLEATQNGKTLPISWEHNNETLRHAFVVSEVKRGDKAGKVDLKWNGAPMDSDSKGDKQQEIPALGEFKLMQAKVVQHPQQYISLHFSDPVKSEQNLTGLVTVEGYTGELKYSVERNQVLVYPTTRITGNRNLFVEQSVRNFQDKKLTNRGLWQLSFQEEKPQVRLLGKGVILPQSEGLVFPFEAINLKAVDIEIFKIFNNNVLQFLQTNDIDGAFDLERVGRLVHQEKVDLAALNPNANPNEWVRYGLDLGKFIGKDPKALYQVRIGFRKEYTDYACEAPQAQADKGSGEYEEEYYYDDYDNNDDASDEGDLKSFWGDWYGIYGYYNGWDWRQREDPCFGAYYNYENFVRRNIVASDFGIIAKTGKDKSVFVAVTDLRTTEPISGATVEVYDYQQQLLQTLTTGSDGTATAILERKPFVAVAKKGEQTGYLKLSDGNALSLSRFDVSGAQTQKGLKGFIYGERGVWRPGDSLYLHFILEDKNQSLPDNYPITFELYDARGQLQEKRATSLNTGGVYPIHCATAAEAPTGNWRAVVKAGGATFEKSLKIETVKPNRLKVNLDPGAEVLRRSQEPIGISLQSNWLHGAPASGLTARVEVQLSSSYESFAKFSDFSFRDPARSQLFYAEPSVVFDGRLDGSGAATFNTNLVQTAYVPGKLRAQFKTRVFEPGGDFSSDSRSFDYHPYEVYVGVRTPEDKYGSKQVEVNKPVQIEFAVVDYKGEPLANRQVNVGIYRVDWRWWWDSDEGYLSDFASSNHYNALESATVKTNNKGIAVMTFTPKEWGRYMVRSCDGDNHCGGEYFYAGYPWYDDEGQSQQGAAMLSFSSDKPKYQVGETVSLQVPASANSRVLITLETGSRVISNEWKEAKAGDNTFTFKTTADMAPTVYAHVSLIQPHGQAQNDLPMRMYGVIPILVEDPQTRLAPQVSLPETLAPDTEFTVEVSEKSGRAMAYTVAIVDEGLLDLTGFKTPNPWDVFYAREALGVRTFDVYDYVLGAYGGQLERLFSVGGDEAVRAREESPLANRFKPVVLQSGPHRLEKGKKAKHSFKMPNYVGSVRVMVIGVNEGAYGAAEKAVPVRQPLMILSTLPRVLGPGESLALPVNVFAMEKGIGTVTVSLEETSKLATIEGGTSKTVSFSRIGDQVVYFNVKMRDATGVATFKISASGGKYSASEEIEVQVRNPNPYRTQVIQTTVDAGKTWTGDYTPFGTQGTNQVSFEVSSIPPINAGKHLDYLIHYPYGCLEQTLSGGFPQLYVDRIFELNKTQKESVPKNIQATVERLKLFQTAEGGFAYWPGESHINHWSSSYAGHFLLEAEKLGYKIPDGMIDRWKKHQKRLAKLWNPKQNEEGFYSEANNELSQAYRLYTLALAKDADMGAMNRLRESNDLSPQAKWRLALAYAVAGQKEVAQKLVQGANTKFEAYSELGGTYGSETRDLAMVLETMVALGDKNGAASMAQILSDNLGGDGWYSTQTLSFSLLAFGKFAEAFPVATKTTFTYKIGNAAPVDAGSDKRIFAGELPPNPGKLEVKNTSNGLLYVRIILTGQPQTGDTQVASENLDMEVEYRTIEGKPLNPARLEQGTDFVAMVTVSHPGFPLNYTFQEMALDQVFPSGWEISNTRMDQMNYFNNQSYAEYQDVRDDRVYTFFDLYPGQKMTYYVRLTAAYQGRFYLANTSCKAMYNNRIFAQSPGQWVEVTLPDVN